MGDLPIETQVLRLVLAAVLGLTIGMEREWREKAAGFRTLGVVSLGAAAFMLFAGHVSADGASRMAAGVVMGVGFLGAGSILRHGGEVSGLTTAAAVWTAAALGGAAAVGAYAVAVFGLVLSLVILLLAPLVELARFRQDSRRYEVTFTPREWDEDLLSEPLRASGLKTSVMSMSSSDEGLTIAWFAVGRSGQHADALRALVADDRIGRVSMSQAP